MKCTVQREKRGPGHSRGPETPTPRERREGSSGDDKGDSDIKHEMGVERSRRDRAWAPSEPPGRIHEHGDAIGASNQRDDHREGSSHRLPLPT